MSPSFPFLNLFCPTCLIEGFFCLRPSACGSGGTPSPPNKGVELLFFFFFFFFFRLSPRTLPPFTPRIFFFCTSCREVFRNFQPRGWVDNFWGCFCGGENVPAVRNFFLERLHVNNEPRQAANLPNDRVVPGPPHWRCGL